MLKRYAQLTEEQRYQIYGLIKAGFSQTQIAGRIGVHKSTISRELFRNRGGRGYRPKQAHTLALQRRLAFDRRRLKEREWKIVEALLCQEWSPEQISRRLWLEKTLRVSHEWIYQYIYTDKAEGGNLYRHLGCQKKRRKRYGSRDRRGKIPNRVSIDERPALVDQLRRFGDWEGDTVMGKRHQGAMVSLVERKSCFTRIRKVTRKTADEVESAVVKCLASLRDRVHTLTLDNGREFAHHIAIAQALKAKVYFAHPYASWERARNENTNGLIRQYFPKGRAFHTISNKEVAEVEDRLNHRPRKKLGFKTPFEVFYRVKEKLTTKVALLN